MDVERHNPHCTEILWVPAGSVEQLDAFSSPFSCVSLSATYEACRCYIAIKRQRASMSKAFIVGWIVELAGMALWLYGYFVIGHLSLVD